MTKRASGKFKRNPRDFYATPYEAVLPLLPHLPLGTSYDEPCAGDGDLIGHLIKHGHGCSWASDINGIHRIFDAFSLTKCYGKMFITNPPWSRDVLHPLITHLSDIAPTWLLFDADWMHTKQAIPFMLRLAKIVSVGRVSWMGNGVSGFDNCCWYLFHEEVRDLYGTQFYGRA